MIEGTANLIRDGKEESIDQKVVVQEGQQIQTGENSVARIAFADGTEAMIGSLTRITLAELDQNKEEDERTIIKLESGKIWNKVKQLMNADAYEIETPTEVMAVRGTLYYVVVDSSKEETYVAALDGAIAIARDQQTLEEIKDVTWNGSKGVLLHSDQQIILNPTDQNLQEKVEAFNQQDLIDRMEYEILLQVKRDLRERIEQGYSETDPEYTTAFIRDKQKSEEFLKNRWEIRAGGIVQGVQEGQLSISLEKEQSAEIFTLASYLQSSISGLGIEESGENGTFDLHDFDYVEMNGEKIITNIGEMMIWRSGQLPEFRHYVSPCYSLTAAEIQVVGDHYEEAIFRRQIEENVIEYQVPLLGFIVRAHLSEQAVEDLKPLNLQEGDRILYQLPKCAEDDRRGLITSLKKK
nr:FecR domain-containing protein [Ammoniphilus resinae]